jgi:hypothetical protein
MQQTAVLGSRHGDPCVAETALYVVIGMEGPTSKVPDCHASRPAGGAPVGTEDLCRAW